MTIRAIPADAARRAATLVLAACVLLPAAAGALTVQDDREVTVTLDAPARRVVSLAPFVTELVFAAGAGERLVAVSEHSDYPAAAKALPRVGNAFNVNLERLLAARPDLVISWQTGIDPRTVERLEAAGVPVFVLEPRGLDDVASALRRVGRLLGTAGEARQRAGAFSRQVAAIRQRYAGREPVRVFYQISRDPLMTLNGRHMVTAILALCGGRNVFHELAPIAPTVNREQVLARDPDAIVISTTAGSDDALAYWRRYPTMRAVRRGNLYTVDGDLLNRQTPRLVEGAKRVCRLLDRARDKPG